MPGEIDSEKDPDKNVKDWLTSSQNHFSAPIQNSETFSQESQQPANPLEVSASNIIIHTDTKKIVTPPKVVHIQPPQDDWDKIEPMPEPAVISTKNENIVGPMDIEPFFVEDEYTTDHPRRSSRKRDLKSDDIPGKMNDLSSNMHSSRDSSGDNDKKSQKAKQNWNNVKKMRKEFSKLNKKNRSKLNVSIEMVKKTQNLKPAINTPVATPQAYNIDDNTPDVTNKENELNNINSKLPIDDKQGEHAYQNTDMKPVEKVSSKDIGKEAESKSGQNQVHHPQNNIIPSIDENSMNTVVIKDNKRITSSKHSENVTQNNIPAVNKMPFIKKGSLNPKTKNKFDLITNDNIEEPVAAENNDDIEITIKVGNTITNIVIKKKQSDVQVKINTDREVQTSLDSHSDKNNDCVMKDMNTRNIDINVENKRTEEQKPIVVNINESQIVQKPRIIENKNLHVVESNLDKTTSGKKNTASADTATAQFEITESVEKELSKIMECDVVDDQEGNVKSIPSQVPQVKELKADKTVEQIENIEDLNDLDIFNSGSVKEANVHILKDNAPSEILGTVRSKFRTQKLAEKRDRENDEVLLPTNKKTKMNSEENVIVQDVPPDSEPINYDAIMGQVFASIDADMEDIRKSQEVGSVSILKEKGPSKNIQEHKTNPKIPSQMQKTQTIKNVASQMNVEITPNLNEYFNERHSENVFSIVEKDDENFEINKTGKVSMNHFCILILIKAYYNFGTV